MWRKVSKGAGLEFSHTLPSQWPRWAGPSNFLIRSSFPALATSSKASGQTSNAADRDHPRCLGAGSSEEGAGHSRTP